MTCKYCKREGHTNGTCRFKKSDLNKVSRPQAHNVKIKEVSEDKSQCSSDNGEDKNEEVYIQAYPFNIVVSQYEERNEIMIPGFSI